MKAAHLIFLMLGLTAGCRAQAVHGGLVDVSIIDGDTGTVLPAHYARGEYWVAGIPGARYAVEVRNRSGQRLLTVMSVDGINVLSGATASWDQEGYVLSPGESDQISGWQKSAAEVATFTFASAASSYAARTGRPANVGVIGVAVFREMPKPALDAVPFTGSLKRAVPSPAPQADTSAAAPAAPSLGTGHGERRYAPIEHTEFVRLQPQPNAVIRIRYDTVENLVALGVLARPRAWPRDPFPGSPTQHYVPDPPG